MSDDAAISDDQLQGIHAELVAGACDLALHLRWLRRTRWVLQGIVLMNVTCAAWNASIVTRDNAVWWLNCLGFAFNVWGGWKAFRVGEDFARDIAKGRALLVEVAKRIQNIERVRNESRARGS